MNSIPWLSRAFCTAFRVDERLGGIPSACSNLWIVGTLTPDKIAKSEIDIRRADLAARICDPVTIFTSLVISCISYLKAIPPHCSGTWINSRDSPVKKSTGKPPSLDWTAPTPTPRSEPIGQISRVSWDGAKQTSAGLCPQARGLSPPSSRIKPARLRHRRSAGAWQQSARFTAS